MVVEDEPVVLSAIQRIVESEGLTMDEVNDAETALDRLKGAGYRILITDLMLPKTSGFDLLKSAKEAFPQLPAIVITGYATLESALQAFKLGSFDFIPKPFDIESFIGVIRRALKYGSDCLGNPSYSPDCLPADGQAKNRNSRPCDFFCLGGHAWVKLHGDGTAEVGIGETFSPMIENLSRVEIPSDGDEIVMGECCARFWTKDGMVNMFWAPLSGKVIAVNHHVKDRAEMLSSMPCDQTWLVRMIPAALEGELEHLTCCIWKKDMH